MRTQRPESSSCRFGVVPLAAHQLCLVSQMTWDLSRNSRAGRQFSRMQASNLGEEARCLVNEFNPGSDCATDNEESSGQYSLRS